MRQAEFLSKIEDLYGENEFPIGEALNKLGVSGNTERTSCHQVLARLCKANVFEKRARGVYCLVSKQAPKGGEIIEVSSDAVETPAPTRVVENGFEHLFEGYEDVYKWVCETAYDHVQTPVQRLVAVVKRARDITTINDNRRKKDEKTVSDF